MVNTAMQHASLPSRRDAPVEPDPNGAPVLATTCPHCGGSRLPFSQAPRSAHLRVCALEPACRAALSEETQRLSDWWEGFEAQRHLVRAETGKAVTWRWHDATGRWVRD